MSNTIGELYQNVIKLDKTVWPKDGQKLRFETYEQYDIIGEFIESEEMIVHDDGNFTFMWQVHSWEVIN